MISIIVPNLHSPTIDKTLESIVNQECDCNYEIIVVGQDRFNIVFESKLIRFIKTSNPVPPSVARNIGIRNSQGDILIFIDADCLAEKGWMQTLIDCYKNPEVMVVGGGVNFPADNFLSYCDNLATFHDYLSSQKPGTRDILPTLNFSIRREVIDSVGYFDESYPLPAGEDADYSTRLRIMGYTLLFEPKASINHQSKRYGIIQVVKHAYHFGQYSVKVDQRYRRFLRTPFLFNNPILLIVLSPIIAFSVVIRIIFHIPPKLINICSIPAIYLIKIIWCVGATRTLLGRNN